MENTKKQHGAKRQTERGREKERERERVLICLLVKGNFKGFLTEDSVGL